MNKPLSYYRVLAIVCGMLIFCSARVNAEDTIKPYYYGVCLGQTTGVIGALNTISAAYEASVGASGSDFTFTFGKLYTDPVINLEIYRWEIPVCWGWGLRFTNSFHPVYGLRAVFSGSYFFNSGKLESFLQLAPMYRLMPSYGVNIDCTVGVKFR
jgi:hypothetical protein